jgi:aspartate/methionine/tyrosine aminotransferase
LKAILGFCNKHRIHLISDEIYAFSVYHTDVARPGFTSVLSLDTTDVIDSSLVHVMYGMSKVRFRYATPHSSLVTTFDRILLPLA